MLLPNEASVYDEGRRVVVRWDDVMGYATDGWSPQSPSEYFRLEGYRILRDTVYGDLLRSIVLREDSCRSLMFYEGNVQPSKEPLELFGKRYSFFRMKFDCVQSTEVEKQVMGIFEGILVSGD